MLRFALVAAAVFAASPSFASPAATQKVIYTVPGITRYNGLGTFIVCTAGTAQSVTVQFYDTVGSAAGSATLALAANQTATFGTSLAGGFAVQGVTSSPVILEGFAQILSTGKGLICSALIADTSNAPPLSMASLPVLKGTKQKGQ